MSPPLKLSSLAFAIALHGCATVSPGSVQELAVPQQDPAYLHLTQSAGAIQDAANRLADVEQARYRDSTGGEAYRVDKDLIPDLEKHVSLGAAWHGPVDKLVDRLAAQVGYSAHEIGVKPSGGVIVNIDTDYRSVLDILHDAGTQAGSRAKITVKAKSKVLEVEYPSV